MVLERRSGVRVRVRIIGVLFSSFCFPIEQSIGYRVGFVGSSVRVRLSIEGAN